MQSQCGRGRGEKQLRHCPRVAETFGVKVDSKVVAGILR